MSFLARVRVKRNWVYDYAFHDAFVLCEDHAEMAELRRLLKRAAKNPRSVTVARLRDITAARYEIEELERAELRAHPEVLQAISAARKETP